MRRLPRRRRASLWAGVYVGLFGTPSDAEDGEPDEPNESVPEA